MNGPGPVRLAVLVPYRNAALEPETYSVLPEGVSAHFWRLRGSVTSLESLTAMASEAEEAAAAMRVLRPRVVAFGCTSGSLLGGPGYEAEIGRLLTAACGGACVTAAGAVAEVLHELGISRLAVATPYETWVNTSVQAFLTECGFAVESLVGLGLRGGISDVPPKEVRRLAREAWAQAAGRAQALFLSCTALHTLSILDDLEAELGCPVVSSNAALLWATLRLAHVAPPRRSFGSLLAGLMPASADNDNWSMRR